MMAAAAERTDLEIVPDLERARALAADHTLVPLRHTFIDDCETPVSAYLKLRGAGPSFLLESAEQGRRFGRWSFLGVQPRALIRLDDGVFTVDGERRELDGGDPYAAVAAQLERYRAAPLEGLPPFAGGAVGLFGYDLVRHAEPTVGQPNPDDVGIPDLALMVSDLLIAFDHLRHEVTVVSHLWADGTEDLETSYAEAVAAIADVRERLSASVPRVEPHPPREPPELRLQHRLGGVRRGRRGGEGAHPRRRRLPGGAEPALVGSGARRGLLDLPRAAHDQPEPLHVLPRLRGLPDRRRVAGVAGEGGGVPGEPAPDRRHPSAGSERAGGRRHRPRAAGRPQGTGRARDAGRSRAQRPRARLRVRHRARGRAHGRRDLLARHAHRLLGVRHPARRRVRNGRPARVLARGHPVRRAEDQGDAGDRRPRAGQARSLRGAVGYVSWSGDLDTCIYIRSAVVAEGRIHVQAGGGIVADSDPELEVRETEHKASAVLRAVELACRQRDWA
ncbi:MAG: chorismate-binding protein [Thermoleophilaceae bacterium]